VSLFITGIDTGVGKTHTTVQLLRVLRVSGMRCAGMKPICYGDRRDAELLLAAGSEGLTIGEINPVWLKTPVAPFAAARPDSCRLFCGRFGRRDEVAGVSGCAEPPRLS
jgi:dethiobiotin synthetase